MHLRMFEMARDAFHDRDEYEVIGGIISPVHDSYRKSDLVAGIHRCAMVNISVQSSDWIRLSDWECSEQTQWTRTRILLQYHQNYINSMLTDNDRTANSIPSWMPPNVLKHRGDKVQVKLLCGADFLESFGRPGLWSEDDVEAILREHGIVVISRSGSNPEQFIFQSDLLSKYEKNIDIVTNWVPNEMSSTLVRRLLRRGRSVKYMLDDLVVEYIRKHRLYVEASSTPSQCNCSAGQSLSPNHRNDNGCGNSNARNNRIEGRTSNDDNGGDEEDINGGGSDGYDVNNVANVGIDDRA